MEMNTHLQSVKYTRGSHFSILDQLLVPHELKYEDVNSVEDAVEVIRSMKVRGAPLIAIVGCLSIAYQLSKTTPQSSAWLLDWIRNSVKKLIDARPTAVNMRKEGLKLISFLEEKAKEENDELVLKNEVIEYIENMYKTDLETNLSIGKFGAEEILQKHRKSQNKDLKVLTHCNTGSLATSGYGTALGVVRSLHKNGDLKHVYFTETRPYNQGSRLTAFELHTEQIPCTLLCDSAVSWLMKKQEISAVIVGADRVAKNGDTANKIGTYQLALVAKAHGVRFYVAAPFSSIDTNISSGDEIVIEERDAKEVTHSGGKLVSVEGIKVYNPAFDVTPAELISGIITEIGVFTPKELEAKIDDK